MIAQPVCVVTRPTKHSTPRPQYEHKLVSPLFLQTRQYEVIRTSGRSFRCPQATEIRLRLPLGPHSNEIGGLDIVFIESSENIRIEADAR